MVRLGRACSRDGLVWNVVAFDDCHTLEIVGEYTRCQQPRDPTAHHDSVVASSLRGPAGL
jgi:hypothetical protein